VNIPSLSKIPSTLYNININRLLVTHKTCNLTASKPRQLPYGHIAENDDSEQSSDISQDSEGEDSGEEEAKPVKESSAFGDTVEKLLAKAATTSTDQVCHNKLQYHINNAKTKVYSRWCYQACPQHSERPNNQNKPSPRTPQHEKPPKKRGS